MENSIIAYFPKTARPGSVELRKDAYECTEIACMLDTKSYKISKLKHEINYKSTINSR